VSDNGSENEAPVISKQSFQNYYDGGLFTGETVLHIAIVQNSSHENLVSELLKRHCNVVARAKGAFFKPKTFFLPTEKSDSERDEDWFFKRLNRLLNGVESMLMAKPRWDVVRGKKKKEERVKRQKNLRRIENLDSACDYGELPLSFAASVGRLDVCKDLLKHVTNGLSDDQVMEVDLQVMEVDLREKWNEIKNVKGKSGEKIYESFEQFCKDSEGKIEFFQNAAWKEFEETTKKQLEAQKIEINFEKRRKKIKEEFLKNHKEMPVDTNSEEGGVSHTMEKMLKDHKNTRVQDVKFYFLNASVDNYYMDENKKKIYYGGNTALHMAVYHRQTEVIRWLMKEGAEPSLGFMNEHHLTPFTLAAKQGYLEIYELLTESMRQTSWVYGQVQMSLLSLEQLDSFRIEGFPLHEQPNWQSAIEVRKKLFAMHCMLGMGFRVWDVDEVRKKYVAQSHTLDMGF
jgi:ankyrin repeat protein